MKNNKEKRKVFCTECRSFVGVHGNKTMNHDYGLIRCSGSRYPLINGFPARKIEKKVFEKKQNGENHFGFIIGERFFILNPSVHLDLGSVISLRETSEGWECQQPPFKLTKSYSFTI